MKSTGAHHPAPRPEYAGAGALEIRAAIERCREAARRAPKRVPERVTVDPFGLIENGHPVRDDVSSNFPRST